MKKSWLYSLRLGTVVTALIVSETGRGDPLDTWNQVYQSPSYVTLYQVAWGNGLFVALGSSGSETSSDGTNWIMHQPGPAANRLAYGNGLFVGLGGFRVSTSTDGLNWTIQPSPIWTNLSYLADITFCNGRFVALGGACAPDCSTSTPIFLTSGDGTNWVGLPLPTSGEFGPVAYGNGLYVAGGLGQVAVSTDGTNWVTKVSASLNSIVYGNGKFVAGLSNGDVGTSADGMTWTFAYRYDIAKVFAFGNGQFVAGAYNGEVLTSADGLTWTPRSTGGWPVSTGVFGGGQFVAIGERAILSSADGVNWTLRQSGCQGQINGITYVDGLFLAADDCGGILASTDGVTWIPHQTAAQVPQSALSAISYGNGQFVAASGSNIVTSTDSTNWVAHPSAFSLSTLGEIVYGGGQFVAWGWDATGRPGLISSPDGTNWTLGLLAPASFSGIAYANGQFVVVGGTVNPFFAPVGSTAAYIVTSVDGIHWAPQQSPTTNFLSGVTYGNGRFVAVGYKAGEYEKWGGSIITSADGTNWVLTTPTNTVHSIAYGNGQFVTMGDNGAVLTSSDGANWTPRALASPWWHHGPSSLAFGNGHFVMVASAAPSAELWGSGTTTLGIWQSPSIINLVVSRQAGGGDVELSLEGPIALSYTIQTSADLVSWTTLTNFTSTQISQVVAVPGASGARAFYRAYAH